MALGLVLLALAPCAGCGNAAVAQAVMPNGGHDTAQLARCSVAASHEQPLVTEWPASYKARLEALLNEGAVAVERQETTPGHHSRKKCSSTLQARAPASLPRPAASPVMSLLFSNKPIRTDQLSLKTHPFIPSEVEGRRRFRINGVGESDQLKRTLG